MTTTTISTAKHTRPRDREVTQARVVRSEWVKLRSLRSTVWTLLVAVLLTVGIAALVAAVTVSQYDSLSREDLEGVTGLRVAVGGINFAQLAIGVLGVLMISGEYGTGMIRASLTVVPRRLPVLWAKLAVFAAVVLPVSLAGSFASFFISQGILSGRHLDMALSADGVLRSVIGTSLYVTVAGTAAIALGALLRTTAAGIACFVGLFFLGPALIGLLPASWGDTVGPYLPSNAGSALYGGATITHPLSPWTGFSVLCVWAAVLVAAAAWRLRRGDA